MTSTTTCAQCSTSYESALKFCPRDGQALRLPFAGDALAGQVVAGRFLVLRKLAEGGMGQVNLAEHVATGRRSAIKVIRTSATLVLPVAAGGGGVVDLRSRLAPDPDAPARAQDGIAPVTIVDLALQQPPAGALKVPLPGEQGVAAAQVSAAAVEPRAIDSRRDSEGAGSRFPAPEEPSRSRQRQTSGDRQVAEPDGVSEVTIASEQLQRAIEHGDSETVERAQQRILRALPRLRTCSDSVRTTYHMAEALIARGQEEPACVLLRDPRDAPGQFRRASFVHYDRYCR